MTKPNELPLVVIDSCCYLHFLLKDDDAKAKNVADLIRNHDKHHTVVVPTTVELETFGRYKTGPGGKYGSKPNQIRKRVSDAREWFSSQQFMPADLDPWVRNTSIRLMAANNLKGMDAVVVATAIVHEATTVFTYDTQMLKAATNIPEVKIAMPPPPGTLF